MNFRVVAVFMGIFVFSLTGCGGLQAERNREYSILNTLRLPAGYQGSGIDVRGSLAYISMMATGIQTGDRSLVIANLEKPAAPAILSTTSSGLASDMAGIVVSGTHAYVPFESNQGTNFQVWDLRTPSSPSVVGSTSISCPAGMFPFGNPVLYGNYVYVSCFESEVTATGAFDIIDVSNPASPSVVATVPVTAGYQPISLSVSGQNLYMVATQGGSTTDYVLLYSIANPTSPSAVATVSTPHSPQWVAAQRTVAVVPIYDGSELQIVDFSNPSEPQTYYSSLGSCHPQSGTAYTGDVVFLPCDSPGGIALVNLAKVSGPTYSGTVLGSTVFNFLVASGPFLYGLDARGNLQTMGF